MNDTIKLHTDDNQTWRFRNNEMQFGVVNTSNGTCEECVREWFDHFHNEFGYYDSVLSMAYPGLGLPEELFDQWIEQINYISNDTMVCQNETGGGCASNLYCDQYFTNSSHNWTDFKFRIGLQHSQHAYMPMSAIMRQYEDTTWDGEVLNVTCELLVFKLDSSKPESDAIILGTPFFQNYFMEFVYKVRDGTKNYLHFTTSPNHFPGAYINDEKYET